MQTLLPAVVPTRLFPRAVAASSAAQQVATISGPALGGLIYAVNSTAVYAICFTMFALAAAQVGFLKYEQAVTRTPVTLAGFFGGISYIRQNRILLGVMVLDLFAVLLGGATALLPIFAKDVFEVDSDRPRHAARRARGRRAIDHGRADKLVVHPPRRPHRVLRGRAVRRRDHRVRVDRIVLAGVVCPRRSWAAPTRSASSSA